MGDGCPGDPLGNIEDYIASGFDLCRYPEPGVEFEPREMAQFYHLCCETDKYKRHLEKQLAVSDECCAMLRVRVLDMPEPNAVEAAVHAQVHGIAGVDGTAPSALGTAALGTMPTWGWEAVQWGRLLIVAGGVRC